MLRLFERLRVDVRLRELKRGWPAPMRRWVTNRLSSLGSPKWQDRHFSARAIGFSVG